MRFLFPLLAALLLGGCSRPEPVSYATLLNTLGDLDEPARLDGPATRLIGSHDRTGANEDYNHFQGTTDDGQCILADLKGPGVVTRLWFTGIQADRKLRFYFDGEREPRLAFSWADLRAGVTPFDCAPVSVDEQNCWHSYLPIPFRRRLLVLTDDAGYRYGRDPKVYYQINWNPVPAGRTVESFSLPLDPASQAALESVAARWRDMEFGPLPAAGRAVTVPAGQSAELWRADAPGTIEALVIETAVRDPAALRHALLEACWDGQSQPSVRVPLGDFFGSVWQRWRGRSMFFGCSNNTFYCRFPMPYRQSARLSLVNRGAQPLDLSVGVRAGPLRPGGYFHAAWRSSGVHETGTPHVVLEAEGRGRFAGCILACMSEDRSFWALEADESMRLDGQPAWQGTGLEDYFNAGWYYQNVFARPLHGLPNKAPFRTVQYRVHLTDPVRFDRSFEMEFERGPNHASRAAFESTAFYYLEAPQPADSRVESLDAPADPLQPHTLMTDLWNFERFGDWLGAADYCDWYNARYKPPFAAILELRKRAYACEAGRLDAPALADALRGSTNAYAAALLKLYTEPRTAVIQFYCNMPSDLYLDGQRILSAGDPARPASAVVPLAPGPHVLAATSDWKQYPLWTQVAVRAADGFRLGTGPDWKHALNPSGAWGAPGYDDSAWAPVGPSDGRVKGPPEEPYIWVEPDPFVNTLSRAFGMRPSIPWPNRQGRVVYRKTFVWE